jgi:membrane-associated protease RseP (regulator of RpoE activity)
MEIVSHLPYLSKEAVSHKFNFKQFIVIALIASLWVHASEVFRYFIFVMPRFREFLSVLPGVAPMDLKVFSIWGLWDTLLTVLNVFVFWLYAQQFGSSIRSAISAGTISWTFFVLFWIAMVNMALSPISLLPIALPLSWLEMVVTSMIASWLYARDND